jgi:hypothetical protein
MVGGDEKGKIDHTTGQGKQVVHLPANAARMHHRIAILHCYQGPT